MFIIARATFLFTTKKPLDLRRNGNGTLKALKLALCHVVAAAHGCYTDRKPRD
jgi:hypothetical protein